MRINPFASSQASSVWDRGSNVRGGRRPPSSVSSGGGRGSMTAADLQNVRGPIVDDRGPMGGRGSMTAADLQNVRGPIVDDRGPMGGGAYTGGRGSMTAADLENVRGPIVDDRGPMGGRGRGGSKPRNRANRSRDLKSRRFQEFLTSFYR